jgi:Putative outer membrane beta-barrel porin, MtrB/PioB
MKIMREIRAVFLAVTFISLTCAAGFADMDVGANYSLGGYIALGGGWLSDQPRHMDRSYLKKYVAFPQGFLAYTDLKLESKDGLQYYRYYMSEPGLTGAQDFLLQAGKLGVYHAQIEYDQLQNLYCGVNPFNNNIGILLQRLRFSGWFSPTLDITLFAEDQYLRRTGWQPATINAGPGSALNFTTFLRAINYRQNDMRVGVEYDQPTDQKSIFQGRVSYHLSTFEDAQAGTKLGSPVPTTNFPSLAPSNMASYITGEGALDLKSYWNTRITGSMSYGWLSQNDFVTESGNAAPTPTLPIRITNGAAFGSGAELGATTFAANIAGLTRPIPALALRYSYNAYNFDNNQMPTKFLTTVFPGTNNSSLLNLEQYNYFKQSFNLGADYRVNSMLAATVGYTFQGTDRSNSQGNTTSSSPQVGIRLTPTNWLGLIANYAYTARIGSNFLTTEQEGEAGIPLTYKFYSGNLNGNKFNVIAEVTPVDSVTASFNFSIYNDNFLDSTWGIQSDRGWSGGMDVGWRPHDRVALSLGYDHQQLQVKQSTPNNVVQPPLNEPFVVWQDAGSILTTSDSYDTFVARADIKLIPKKLDLTTRASYSIANSNFNTGNPVLPNLNEYYANIRTFLTYTHDEHWALRAGYIFEAFAQSQAYQTLYLQGVTTPTTRATGLPNPAPGTSQQFNTLDGFYRNATAHIVQAFVQYKF